jgi:hypothetical protein
MNPFILMSQYITTLSFGKRTLHLSHSSQQVFSSRHYTTGGSSVGGIVFRGGQFRDARQPRRILDGAELHHRLHIPPLNRWQVWGSRVNELVVAWSLPFRKCKERRWNELLG